ncbi:hypothetical protein DRN69_04505 [Candidatus Pacearchaeota archaeon]|nr:MAG: hypothetical protein DRN69_04505 [Candidatus Pacearchaeota archaeon]
MPWKTIKLSGSGTGWREVELEGSGTGWRAIAFEGWLTGYGYRKKGAVNATTAGAQSNYQMKLVVGESSGASGCDVHCENHCQNFPNDIRFTKEDGETLHDYWLEKIEGESPNRKATFWIEVDTIPASGSVDLYMYYGKSGESSASDGEATFDFFTKNNVGEHLSFSEIESLGVDKRAWQGVTSDGTYLYTFTNKEVVANDIQKIYKFNKSGEQLDVNSAAGTDHMSDGYYYNGKLYVADMKDWYEDQPHSEAKGQIRVYDTTSGLPYANESHEVGDHWAEGVTYYDGYWWIVYHCCSIIRKYDSNWNFVKEYDIAGHGGTEGSWSDGNGYQGIVFFEDSGNTYVGLTVHGTVTGGPEFYYFKYENDTFTLVEHFDPPNEAANQGWDTDDPLDISDVWFADRYSSAIRHQSGSFIYEGSWDEFTDRTGGKIEQVDTPQKRSSSKAFKYTQEETTVHGMFRDLFPQQTGKFVIEFDANVPQTNKRMLFALATNTLTFDSDSYWGPYLQFDDDGTIQIYTTSWETIQSYSANQWYKIGFVVSLTDDNYDVYIDDTLKLSDKSFFKGNTLDNLEEITIGGYYSSAGISYIQDVRLRKYADPEPTWGNWESEEGA